MCIHHRLARNVTLSTSSYGSFFSMVTVPRVETSLLMTDTSSFRLLAVTSSFWFYWRMPAKFNTFDLGSPTQINQ
jgi:hypothetical protein